MNLSPVRFIYLSGVLQTEGSTCAFQSARSAHAGRLKFTAPAAPGMLVTIIELDSAGAFLRRYDFELPDRETKTTFPYAGDEAYIDLDALTPQVTEFQARSDD